MEGKGPSTRSLFIEESNEGCKITSAQPGRYGMLSEEPKWRKDDVDSKVKSALVLFSTREALNIPENPCFEVCAASPSLSCSQWITSTDASFSEYGLAKSRRGLMEKKSLNIIRSPGNVREPEAKRNKPNDERDEGDEMNSSIEEVKELIDIKPSFHLFDFRDRKLFYVSPAPNYFAKTDNASFKCRLEIRFPKRFSKHDSWHCFHMGDECYLFLTVENNSDSFVNIRVFDEFLNCRADVTVWSGDERRFEIARMRSSKKEKRTLQIDKNRELNFLSNMEDIYGDDVDVYEEELDDYDEEEEMENDPASTKAQNTGAATVESEGNKSLSKEHEKEIRKNEGEDGNAVVASGNENPTGTQEERVVEEGETGDAVIAFGDENPTETQVERVVEKGKTGDAVIAFGDEKPKETQEERVDEKEKSKEMRRKVKKRKVAMENVD